FPVCSPDYLRGRPQFARVEQLLGETLLFIDDDRPGHADWPHFFAEHGVKLPPAIAHIKMNSLPLLLQAASEGQGIALGYGLLTDDLIARRPLVRPLAASIRTSRSYYVLLSEQRSSHQAIAFRDWLLAQCGRNAQALAEPSQSVPADRAHRADRRR